MFQTVNMGDFVNRLDSERNILRIKRNQEEIPH